MALRKCQSLKCRLRAEGSAGVVVLSAEGVAGREARQESSLLQRAECTVPQDDLPDTSGHLTSGQRGGSGLPKSPKARVSDP